MTGPSDTIAEGAVLGAIMMDREQFDAARAIVSPEDFTSRSHRVVFEAMDALSQRKVAIDLISVSGELVDRGTIDVAGGMPSLASLETEVPFGADVRGYATRVREMALRRAVVDASQAAARAALDQSIPLAQVLDQAESRMLAVRDARASERELRTIADSVRRNFDALSRRYEVGAEVTGVATGFAGFDKLTTGLHPGQLVILAARSGLGKTTLAMNVAANVATAPGGPGVLVFSLEMDEDSLVLRLMGSEARLDGQLLRTGTLDGADFPRLGNSCNRLHKARLYVHDASNATVPQMRSIARRAKSRYGVGLVIVDYLQLANPAEKMGGGRGRSREQEVSEISRGLKLLARDVGLPVIALAQLNRGVDTRAEKRPMLSDLRESGAIEQDADIVSFIYRAGAYDESAPSTEAEWIIAKHRAGPTGKVPLRYSAAFSRFEDAS